MFGLPPAELQRLDPILYDYLLALHLRVFGVNGHGGDLDNLNVSDDLAVDHSKARNLDLDGHAQYLNLNRHGAVRGNPHQVGPTDVGNTTAQWNASQLQGNAISPVAPESGNALVWDGTVWAPTDASGLTPGAPGADPVPQDLAQASVGADAREDQILWDYDDGSPSAHGFVIFWQLSDTANPTANGVKVSVAQRSFRLVLPRGTVASYAIAAYRTTGSGEILGTKVQHATWKGATDDGSRSLTTVNVLVEQDLVGTKNHSNTVFTFPYTIRTGPNSKPLALLEHRISLDGYTTTDPPGVAEWTIRQPGQLIVLGDPPWADDILRFKWVVVA